MKNIIKNNLAYKAVILTVFLLFTTCDKSIDIYRGNEEAYQTSNATFAYIINEQGKKSSSFVEFRNEGTTNVYVALSKGVESEVTASLKYDESALEAYNQSQQTDYEAFPQELIEFTGATQIAKEKLKSNKVSIQLKTSDALDSQKTYVIPLSFELTSNNIKRSETNANYFIFVKDLSKIPDPAKVPDPDKYPAGIKIISCPEINDTNPLLNLQFKLKNSGKPLFDMVVLFADNMAYCPENGRVHALVNGNVSYVINNYKKYIKPLKDQGIKVILGLLSPYISEFTDETAKSSAQELKTICDAYHLDGVLFDDEYEESHPTKGFVSPSTAAAARFMYETKQAMPDRLVLAYALTSTYPGNILVDGHKAGDYVDYGICDYGLGDDLSSSYPGMPKSNMCLYSQEFARNNLPNEYALKTNLRDEGYGSNFIFAMGPDGRSLSWNSQIKQLQLTARALFDDELEIYGKDGAKLIGNQIYNKQYYYRMDWPTQPPNAECSPWED